MTHDERMALIHAEIDGELDGGKRRELAERLLAEPQTRALRDEMRDLCTRLDTLGQVESPPELAKAVLSRLPATLAPASPRWAPARWRLAALIAGVVTAGTLVYQVVQGPGPGSSETAGTMASGSPTLVDSVTLAAGPVTGQASLYRDKAELAVALEVSAAGPIDVLINGAGRSFKINGLESTSPAKGARQLVPLPQVPLQGEDIELTFLVGGQPVQRATLHAPATH